LLIVSVALRQEPAQQSNQNAMTEFIRGLF
jgi:hypothetical protein